MAKKRKKVFRLTALVEAYVEADCAGEAREIGFDMMKDVEHWDFDDIEVEFDSD